MKKLFQILTLLLTFNLFVVGVNAKDTIKLKECEYSEAYKKWLKLSDAEKEKVVMPAVCKDAYLLNNYKFGNGTTTIPEKYDLRTKGYVNEVKNQYDTGLCWTFSTLTSIESNLLVKGLGKYDFSEGHMELATSNSLYTPSRVTFNRIADSGANPLYSQAYLLNQWGPINEADLDFLSYYKVLKKSKNTTAAEVESKKSVVDINETVVMNAEQGVCSSDSIKNIKNYIMKHGALNGSLHMSAMYADGMTIEDEVIKGPYVNGAYYYYDGSTYNSEDKIIAANAVSDHAVTIIGWDDTIEPSNFASSHQPKNKGAWIIQNSYGETVDFVDGTSAKMGDEGYYYISYEDVNICGMLGGYYDTDLDVPKNAYYYDDLGFAGLGYQATNDVIYQGSVFTKKSDKTEVLNKVTFGTYEIGIKYTVYFADNGSLKDYKEIGSGITDHFGYTTVKVTDTQEITSDKYSIVVKFEGINNKFIPVSAKLDDVDILDNLNILSNVTFLSMDGASWADTATGEFNTTVRAYTNEINKVTEPEETPGDDEVKDDSDVEVEKNDGTVIEGDNSEQGGNTTDPDAEYPKDDTVESPKTGIEDYVIILIGGIFIVAGIYYFISKKNLLKKI